MVSASTVINGTLKLDGTIELEKPPQLPPGPARVSLEAVPTLDANQRLPDPPWLDENIPAPFDLPHLGKFEIVEPIQLDEHLPEPFEWEPEDRM